MNERKIYSSRIDDVDFYIGVGLICAAVGSAACCFGALTIAIFCWIMGSIRDRLELPKE